jgi:thiamine-phosphate pyrophosphorylase
LWESGCAGVHVGQDDTPAAAARAFLGDGPLIGVSTHTPEQVVEADDGPADCLGFGPVHATGTKGYARGLGSEACWIASLGTSKPLFPIGGIGVENAHELARVGRAAVGAAILAADDPAAAARAIRASLEDGVRQGSSSIASP